MNLIKFYWYALLACLILSGCALNNLPALLESPTSPRLTISPTPLPLTPTAVASQPTLTPAVGQQAMPTLTLSSASTKTPTRAPSATLPAKRTALPLALTVISPKDESIVNTASIPVIGQSIATAVISVNEKLVIPDAQGKFQTTINLDEGPNIIEVIASDSSGKEIDVILNVIYQP